MRFSIKINEWLHTKLRFQKYIYKRVANFIFRPSCYCPHDPVGWRHCRIQHTSVAPNEIYRSLTALKCDAKRKMAIEQRQQAARRQRELKLKREKSTEDIGNKTVHLRKKQRNNNNIGMLTKSKV